LPAKAAPKKSKSAKKRVRQAGKLTLRNRSVKSALKTLTKKVESEVAGKNLEGAAASLHRATSLIDKARTKGIIHRNTAARKVSRLTKLVNSLSKSAAGQ
jgi:small subunit ribosomal protein S20